ncbi:MAG: hypothetical protein H6725_23470 [Sandaracinaceae bacterium]|nr:hypothetical protein [Sandaracinaceae bacterium]
MTEKKPISARPAIGRVETRAIPAREVNAALRGRDRDRAREGAAGRNSVTEDVVGVTELSAVGTATDRPPAPEERPSSEIQRVTRLVAELAGATPGVEGPTVHALLRYGDTALVELTNAFPGAVWFNRQQTATRLPKGRGVSGVASALVEFGAPAVPHVHRLLADPDPDKRYFALLVGAELDADDFPERAVSLVCDPDAGVSNIAILAIKAHTGRESRTRAMQQLYERLAQPSPPVVPLLRAFGVLRDPGCVPHVAGLLEHPHAPVVEAAERILRAVTARDLGRKPARWRTWYKRRAHKTRSEWLLDAARSFRLAERTLAAEELQQLTGETYDFVPSGGWRARRSAIALFRAHLATLDDAASRERGAREQGAGRGARGVVR